MKIYKNLLSNNKYEIVLQNDKNEVFKIHYGGADLYWSMSDYKDDNFFVITKEDKIFYNELEKLFEQIQESAQTHNGFINNNCFEWLSESTGLPEEAHKLIIKKENERFQIKFIRNPENFSPSNTCFISFCLSGSKNQKIANAFSTMFLHCKTYNIKSDDIKNEQKNDEKIIVGTTSSECINSPIELYEQLIEDESLKTESEIKVLKMSKLKK